MLWNVVSTQHDCKSNSIYEQSSLLQLRAKQIHARKAELDAFLKFNLMVPTHIELTDILWFGDEHP
jgi:hypothetical protein